MAPPKKDRWVEQFISYLEVERSASPRTVIAYRHALERFRAFRDREVAWHSVTVSEFREFLRGIAEHLASGRAPTASDLRVLNAALMVPARQKLVQRQNGFRAEALPVRFGWPWILSRIAASLADTLTQFDRERVKICANDGCRWAYYDVTKGKTRRWCNTRTCGNRDRVRRARAAAKRAR